MVIDHASLDPVYRDHHTPRIDNIESYLSVPIIRPGGTYFGNLCAIDPRPAVVSDPRIVAMFTAFADLIAMQLESEDRQNAAETELVNARATAELREQFIAVLGHDLRNPLSAVGATAELLSRRTEPELVRLGTRLGATTRRMSQLINDVLDLARSRLGAGMGVVLEETTELAAALNDVVFELREAHPQRRIDADIAIARPVRCDRGRLQQLLSNLLGNALTYGAVDRPVRVSAAIEGEQLVLEVANEGVPIASGDLARVFEPYWRPLTSKPGGGLGLGLYICAQIAMAHGGAMRVESSAEAGTVFSARLPIVA